MIALLRNAAARLPGKVALVYNTQRITYAELALRVRAFAHGLIARGVESSDRVLVFADNTVETVVSFWAALAAGARVSIVNPLVKSDKLAWLLDDSRAKVLITDAHLASVFVDAVRRAVQLRVVIASGEPRADVCAFSDVTADRAGWPERDGTASLYAPNADGIPRAVTFTPDDITYAQDDVVLDVLPLSSRRGLQPLIASVRAGATLVLERSFAFAAQVMQRIAAERVTVLPSVPTLRALLGNADLSSLRLVTNDTACERGVFESRGELVAPKEIERVLLAIRGVTAARVIGVPDALLGNAIKATLAASIDAPQIRRACHAKLEGFLVPKHIELVT